MYLSHQFRTIRYPVCSSLVVLMTKSVAHDELCLTQTYPRAAFVWNHGVAGRAVADASLDIEQGGLVFGFLQCGDPILPVIRWTGCREKSLAGTSSHLWELYITRMFTRHIVSRTVGCEARLYDELQMRVKQGLAACAPYCKTTDIVLTFNTQKPHVRDTVALNRPTQSAHFMAHLYTD